MVDGTKNHRAPEAFRFTWLGVSDCRLTPEGVPPSVFFLDSRLGIRRFDHVKMRKVGARR